MAFFTIDEEAARKQMNLDMSRAQEVVRREADGSLPQNWVGTTTRGLPVKELSFLAFPRVVYLYPNAPTKTVVHRNSNHEVVHEEEIPLEHLTRTISCDAHKNGGPADCPACNKLLEAALDEGWQTKPYIPAALPKPDAHLYGRKKNAEKETKQ